MMITTPSAPGGAAAAPSALPGVAMGDAAFASTPAPAEGTVAAEATPALVPFAQLLDFATLALPGDGAGTGTGATTPGEQPASETADAETKAEADPAAGLAAMMPVLNLAVLPAVQQQAAATAGMAPAGFAATQARANTLLPGASDAARQAAADAITAGGGTATSPLAARLLQGALPAAGEAVAANGNAVARQASPAAAGGGTATPAQAATVATVLAAQDGAAQSGTDGQSSQQQGDSAGTFRGVLAAAAPAAGSAAPADTVKLVGNPDTWQQPLRAALGDRLQVTLQKGSDQAANMAVIRLEPPNLGSIEISIRQTAGALHVSMSASNSEVVRQLNAVGDSMRQDLSQRQYGDVAVTVSQASSRSLADSEGRGRQPEREAEQRGPGRALSEGDETNTTFAMLRE